MNREGSTIPHARHFVAAACLRSGGVAQTVNISGAICGYERVKVRQVDALSEDLGVQSLV